MIWNTNNAPREDERERRIREMRERLGYGGDPNQHPEDAPRSRAQTPADWAPVVQDEPVDDRVINAKLLKFGRNLNDEVRGDKTDPVIGRDAEIRRAIRILSRKTKNNPILIGEPGVGKTAIVEGLAQRIVKGDVPETLLDKQIYSLDLGALMAGTKFQGELEERLQMILGEIREKEGKIILFIDEMHLMVGMGSDKGVDMGNMLKPMLARGELRCVGATTLDEYKKNVEKDAALERRFQTILVEQPNVDDALSILRGLKERYETFHGVAVRDNALVAAVKLSHRYIADRFLPDKAIDLVDEACAMIRTELDSMPAELDTIMRRITMLEVEEKALRKETDTASRIRLDEIVDELTELRENGGELLTKWNGEKALIKDVVKLRKMIEAAKAEMEVAERKGVLDRVAEIKYGSLPRMLAELSTKEGELKALNGSALLHDAVDESEIATVVSRWTGIPVTKLSGSEAEKILNIGEEIHKRVIGQNEAVELVGDAIIRARSGIKDPRRPIGSFIFLGPTGVGKTELAKALAESLFDTEQNIIRIDMSEYMEKHSVSRMVGSPPGYVGFEDGGQLTETVRRKPFSVVLFDEIEKAHPDVFNIMLQILDDGRCTDGQGRTVDFKNTVIIMTSNVGSQFLLRGIDSNGNILETAKNEVMSELKKGFRPEFLNRIDDIVLFKPLAQTEIKSIVELCLNDIRKRLEDKRITLTITEDAKEFVVREVYDPVYGARPLKRFLTHQLETQLGKALLSGQVREDATVVVGVANGKLVIQ